MKESQQLWQATYDCLSNKVCPKSESDNLATPSDAALDKGNQMEPAAGEIQDTNAEATLDQEPSTAVGGEKSKKSNENGSRRAAVVAVTSALTDPKSPVVPVLMKLSSITSGRPVISSRLPHILA